MSNEIIVDVNPQVSVMFQDNKAVKAFIDINAVEDNLNELIEQAKQTAESIVQERKAV